MFLSLTKRASAATRRSLARRVAINSFFVMSGSLLVGAVVLKLYGISVPVLRVAGGLIVAVSGWKLLNEGSQKATDDVSEAGSKTDYFSQAFYPLTLPLTTGPGTIAVMISLGLSRSAYSDYSQDFQFFVAAILAAMVMAVREFTSALPIRIGWNACWVAAARTSRCGCRHSFFFVWAFKFSGRGPAICWRL